MLLNEVQELQAYYPMNYLVVYENSAFPVVAARIPNANSDILLPVVAAGRYKKGKILGVYHQYMFVPTYIYSSKFIKNCIQWTGSCKLLSDCSVGFFSKSNNKLLQLLSNSSVSYDSMDPNTMGSLNPQIHQVVIIDFEIEAGHVALLARYVEQGGGLIFAVTPLQPVYGHFGTKYLPNKITALAGFVFSNKGRLVTSYSYNINNIPTSMSLLSDLNVLDCWTKVKDNYNTDDFLEDPINRIQLCTTTISEGLEHIPKTSSFFSPQFYNECKDMIYKIKQPFPTESNPFASGSDIAATFQLYMFHAVSNYVLRPEDVIPHSGSKDFPGDVNQNKKSIIQKTISLHISDTKTETKHAPLVDHVVLLREIATFGDEYIPNHALTAKVRQGVDYNETVIFYPKNVKEQLIMNSRLNYWHFTGLYAAPGEVIEVEIINNLGVSNYISVQIGSTVNDIPFDATKLRSPKVTSEFFFENYKSTLKVASPWGGQIYIVLPGPETTAHIILGNLSLIIRGAIEAPHFLLGTTKAEWEMKLADSSAPWLELEGKYISASFQIKKLPPNTDVERCILFWDTVLDSMANLRNASRNGYRKQRIVFEVIGEVISYDDFLMVSADFGYPQTYLQYFFLPFLSLTSPLFTVLCLRMCVHHNLENITWKNTNFAIRILFINYVQMAMQGKLFQDLRTNPKSTIYEFISNGSRYVDWEAKWETQAYCFMDLQRNFGWALITHIFTDFDNVNVSSVPTTTEAKRDYFVIAASKHSGYNLASYFRTWGWPISKETEDKVVLLPNSSFTIQDALN